MVKMYQYGRYGLLAFIVGMNLYTILTPWLPMLTYKVDPPADHLIIPKITAAPARSSDQNDTPTPTPAASTPPVNTLYIPSIGLKEEVFEGDKTTTLNSGVWRRPNGSTPELGSNTVMAGHRFSYRHRPVFYHLDKVKVGDEVLMDWKELRYTYKVTEIKIVNPNNIAVEDATEDERLTIYTCTPLVTASQRLVIIAKRQESQ